MSSFFTERGIILDSDREVYAYSFEVLIATVINLLILLIVAVISGTSLHTGIFLLGFIPLRLVAGGYHAKNHIRCFMIMMSSYAVFLLLLFHLPSVYETLFIVTFSLLSVILVVLMAPSDDVNKPLAMVDINRFKIISRLLVTGYAVIIIFLIIIPLNKIALSITFGNLNVGLSLLANKIKQNHQ